MPALNEIGRQYANRGVSAIAVNIGESKGTYHDFVKSHQYDHVRWARDSSGEIAGMYSVRGIPTTYVVDQEGLIRYAHVGYGESVRKSLERAIEALLD